MKRVRWVALVAAGIPLAAVAQEKPPAAELADGPGREVVVQVCGECHDAADHIVKFRKTAEQWSDVIADMQTRGAMPTDEEIKTIVTYLATYYGATPQDQKP